MALTAKATAQQSDGAVSSAAKQHTTTKPAFLGASGQSKLPLAKPLTQRARRIVKKKTDRLIQKRDQVDKALLEEAARDHESLRPKDFLPRQHIIRLDDALARREARHLRACIKAVAERERLYKWDPSTERQIDLDLLNKYLFKFKRNLGGSLPDRERPLQQTENDDGASSDSADGDEADGRADQAPESNPESASDGATHDSGSESNSSSGSDQSDEGGPNDGSTKVGSAKGGDNGQSYASLDGAFDDHVLKIQKNSKKKKKPVDEPRASSREQEHGKKAKQARKEQAAAHQHDATTLGSLSLQSIVRKKNNHAGDQAAIDSMPQSKKLPSSMTNGALAIQNFPDSHISSTTANDKTADEAIDNTVRVSILPATTNATKGDQIPTPPASVITQSSQPDAVPTSEPWYKLYAKRHLQHDFNDLVRSKPNSGPDRGCYMSGAMNAPPCVVTGGGLPSPRASSSPSSHSLATKSKTKTDHKSQGGGSRRKNKTEQGMPRSRPSSPASLVAAKVRSSQASTQMPGT